MQSQSILTLLSVCVLFTACSLKTEKVKVEPIKFDPIVINGLEGFDFGGQPGAISLNGKLVKEDGSMIDQVSLRQELGKPADKIQIKPENRPKLNSKIEGQQTVASKTGKYMNLNCNLKDDPRIEGLEEYLKVDTSQGEGEKKDSVVSTYTVDKAFLCGNIETKDSYLMIDAPQIYLSNLNLIQRKTLGAVWLTSNELHLEGKNSILTIGESSNLAFLYSAASISITVHTEIKGSGQLFLESIGGDLIKK